MSPWEERYVCDIIDELDRLGRLSSAVASTARTAAKEERYRDALELAFGASRHPDRREDVNELSK